MANVKFRSAVKNMLEMMSSIETSQESGKILTMKNKMGLKLTQVAIYWNA